MRDLSPHIGIFITHQEVTGKGVSMADAIYVLSRLNIHGVLRMIATLNATFVDPFKTKEELRTLQDLLVSRFFDDELKNKLKGSRYNQDLDVVVFHRQQQLMMLRLALTACSTDEGLTWDKEAAFLFGKACLMVNDIAGPKDDEFEKDGSLIEVATRLLPIGELPADSQTAGLVGRAYEMWLQIPDQLELQKPKTYVPIAARFEEFYHVSLYHFVQGLFMILTKTDSFNPRNQNAFDALVINANTYLDNVSFPKETFRKLLDIISCKLETLKDKLVTEPVQNTRFDFSLLRRYPLIEVEPNVYLCHDTGFLRKFFTDGIYWRIYDSLTSREQGRFRTFFGSVLADYVEKIMSHVYVLGQNAPKHLFKSRLDFAENRGEVCDIFLQCDDAWIVIETKASLLTTRAKYSGDSDVLEQEIQTKFVQSDNGKNKGVGQLANSIKMLVTGLPTNASEIQLVQCSKIYPVLISYDSAITSPLIPQYLETEFLAKIEEMPQHPKIMPLTVLSIDDVEVLTTIRNKHVISTVLSTYHHFRLPAETLSGFLFRYPYYQIDLRLSRFYNSFLALSDTITPYFG